MVKLKNSNDKERLKIVKQELEEFTKLIRGHQKILEAIGKI